MESNRLAGKVAMITGASSGIGCAAVRRFHEEGAWVIAAARYTRPEELAQWEGAERVIPMTVDVTKLEDIQRMVETAETRFGRLDALCNIAGMNDLHYTLEDTDDARWDRIMDLDLKAPFRICRLAVPLMLKGGGGAIVNIGSYAALRGNHGPSYTAAKTGLVGLTRRIAFGYGPQGIRCNIVHPGGVDTDIGPHSGGAFHPIGLERIMKIAEAYPSGWHATPEEVAACCLFLCSDDARHVNGAELSVDGGTCCC